MNYTWPEEDDLTVKKRVGIGTETPSQKLDVKGDSIIDGSLTINQNLAVSGNFQLGTLSINEFSSDGNLADNSNLAVPTEQAVKTYVDNQINTRAALNGGADEDFATNNLSVDDSLTVSNGISTKQLSVAGSVTGSLTVENDLTVGGSLSTKEVNASGTITANRFEGDGSALTGISTSKWFNGSSGSIYYNRGNVGIGTSNPTAKLEIEGTLKLQSGVAVNEFSSDTALGGNSNLAVPTEKAVKTYVENRLSGISPSQWSNGSSGRIYYNRGNVGIGTSNPGAKLEIRGNLKVRGIMNTETIRITRDKSPRLVLSKTGDPAIDWEILTGWRDETENLWIGVPQDNGALGLMVKVTPRNNDSYGFARFIPKVSIGNIGERDAQLAVRPWSTVSLAGYFDGNVHVKGRLSKGSGTFLIDHPLDPLNKTLRHSLVESPENLCLYRGKIKLNHEGNATVKMPNYFAALTKEEDATVQLTPIGQESSPAKYEWNSDYTAFTIFGEQNTEVSYLVLADRDDPVIHQLNRPVEEDKGTGNFEKGKLLYPEAYEYPANMGVDYREEESIDSETLQYEDLDS